MRARLAAAAVVVLLALVVGAQLGYTEVGQPVGARWSDPATLASSPVDESRVLEVAAAGDGETGAVAWLTRSGDTYRVEVARVTAEAGTVEVGPRRTVASGATELESVDVAVDGDAVALAWERSLENDVVLYADGEARVVSDDPLRVLEPSVALVDGGAVVAWQQYNGGDFAVEVAGATADGDVTRTAVSVETGGIGSPSVDAAGDGFALVWYDDGSRSTRAAFGRLGPDGPTLGPAQVLGAARPSGGFGGGASGAMAVDGAARGDAVRAVWLDVGTVTTAASTRGGSADEPTTHGRGDRPRVAVAEDRWLAAWVVTGRAADTDLRYAAGGEGTPSGTLSRFPSSANHPSPFYAPDAAVAWSERGGESRVLVAGLRETPDRRYLARLTTEPGRLAFVGVAALVVAVVTLPIMPWLFVSMLVAFYLTTRLARSALVGALARLAGLRGDAVDPRAVETRLDDVPPEAWAALFAAGEVALLVVLLPPVGANVSLSFAGPVVLSLGAAAGTAALQAVERQRSPWRIIAVFAYLQTAALWATALPDVL